MPLLSISPASSFSLIGAIIATAAYQEASGNAEISNLNKMWLARGSDRITSTRAQRIGSLLGYIFSITQVVLISAYVVGAMEKDIFAEGYTNVKKDHNKITLIAFFFWMLSMLAILSGRWKISQPTPVSLGCIALLQRGFGIA